MSLCEQFRMPREQLLASMDNSELTRLWVRHRYISPIPDISRQLAKIVAAIYNTSPNRTRESLWYDAEDFMPIIKPTPQPMGPLAQTPDEQSRLAGMVHKALGGQ